MSLFASKSRRRSRFEDRLQDFRGWWLGLEPDKRARNEGRLQAMGQIAGELMSDAGDGFGQHLWSLMLEATSGFLLQSKEPKWFLAKVRRVFPEVWPLIEPYLSADLRAGVAAELSEEDTQP